MPPTQSTSTSPLNAGSTELDLPTAFSPHTCLKKGLCPVTSLREQGPEFLESHSLYYELHGPKEYKHKVVFIMGLNSSSFSWGHQVIHFGDGGVDGSFAALVFDNRGVGNSGYPKGPYTTSGMAEDAICLLDHLGWTQDRELNIVGISLGGMIAQELAYRIPKRIASLVLAVTTPGGHWWNNFPPLAGFLALGKLNLTPDPIKRIPIALPMLFPRHWLEARAEGDEQGRTNYQVQSEGFLRRVVITKPQQLIGGLSQMAAGLTHFVSPERLAYIARNVPKITIVTGDDDHLVRPSGSKRIHDAMISQPAGQDGGKQLDVELIEWEETGHGIHMQRLAEFDALIERSVLEGEKRLSEGYKGADV